MAEDIKRRQAGRFALCTMQERAVDWGDVLLSGAVRSLTVTVWFMCLLSGHATGEEPHCSDFLSTEPASPVLRMMGFSRDHSPCGLPFNITANVSDLPLWDPKKPSVVIIPGKRPPVVQPSWVRNMAGDLLTTGRSNVLAADWLVPGDQKLIDGARDAGESLAQVIQALLAMGSSPEMFHLVGFGVGAHVAGIAGASLHGSIGRITGLDPFAPTFTEADPSLSLDHTDAQFVDVIHTNFNPNEPVAALGASKPSGHVDFYVGKGHLLPGCPQGLIGREKYLLCSHHRAHQLFTSSIHASCPLTAFPCNSLADFKKGRCTHCDWPGLHACPQLGFNITWLPSDRPIPFQPLTAVLDITSVAPFCVTPFLLELQIGGDSPLEAQLFIRLKGGVTTTSTMLLSGPDLMSFEPTKGYQFQVSANCDGDFTTMQLEFYTERLLYLDWRKRKVKITELAERKWFVLVFIPTSCYFHSRQPSNDVFLDFKVKHNFAMTAAKHC
ncbi:hypothetical protein MATL_G00121330 [Megalops atlanticus]|uniref:Phospholipase A1 member A n=1 Tax=Megalops atlanticus TaxID=7932 RepID=A0A9D3PZU0_MEGAT|nr:hypothetical protein MATL_G00121330 [Megalops atlanticus]